MNRNFRIALGLSLLATSAADLLPGQGPKEAARCAGCHGMADPGVPGDDLWLLRIRTTACVQPAAPKGMKLRQELIDWFGGKRQERPAREDAARAAGPEEGTIVPGFERGSVLLWPEGDGGERRPVRLVWAGEAKAAPERAVPAGDYVVRNYKIQRADAAGTEWQIWGSGAAGRKVRIDAGSRATLDLDLSVHVKPMAMDKGRQVQLGLGVTGDSGLGLTVIRGQDRVPATAVIRDAGGKALTKADLRYG